MILFEELLSTTEASHRGPKYSSLLENALRFRSDFEEDIGLEGRELV